MTTEKLIIDGVDHAKFDLEWAKRGGVCVIENGSDTTKTAMKYVLSYTIYGDIYYTFARLCLDTRIEYGVEHLTNQLSTIRMATPQECLDAGIEYIEPPIRWRPIETAPKDGTEFLGFNSKTKGIKIFKYDNDIYARKPKPFFSSGDPRVTYDRENQPTHWMPLPPPPKDE